MPVPTAGLIEVTLTQTAGATNLENVFYFWNSLNIEPISFIGFSADWDTKYMPGISSIQGLGVTYTNVRIRTVLGVLPDLNSAASIPVGTRAGESLPSYVAIGFRLGGTTKETRSGAKRFGGQTETDIAGNTPTTAYAAVLDGFAPTLTQSVFDGLNTYQPVILSRPTPTRGTFLVNPIIVATRNLFVTTQNSRKRRA
jgi:hypothetical protein